MIGPGMHVPFFHVPPDSINVVTGIPTGDVSDIQTWQDGNILQVQETAGTPALDVEITFLNVTDFRRLGISMWYQGSATHSIEVQLWNVTKAAWDTVFTFNTCLTFNYRYSDIPILFTHFIDVSGNVKMRLCHPQSGNAAHNIFVDYAALIR